MWGGGDVCECVVHVCVYFCLGVCGVLCLFVCGDGFVCTYVSVCVCVSFRLSALFAELDVYNYARIYLCIVQCCLSPDTQCFYVGNFLSLTL